MRTRRTSVVAHLKHPEPRNGNYERDPRRKRHQFLDVLPRLGRHRLDLQSEPRDAQAPRKPVGRSRDRQWGLRSIFRPNQRRDRTLVAAETTSLPPASARCKKIVRRDESSEKRGHHPQRESPAGGGARGGRGAFRRTLAKHALVAHSTISMARHTARRHRAEHPFPLRSNADRPVIHLPPEVRSGSRGSQGGEGRLEPQPRSRRQPVDRTAQSRPARRGR